MRWWWLLLLAGCAVLKPRPKPEETAAQNPTTSVEIPLTPPKKVTPPKRAKKEKIAVSKQAQQVVQSAKQYLNTPYKYGGMGKDGIDCSGLVCKSFESVGIVMPRTSRAQAQMGKKLTLKEVAPGDLLFFSYDGGKTIGHVGIVTEVKNNTIYFIHATRHGVRIDSLEDPYWKKYFHSARTVLR